MCAKTSPNLKKNAFPAVYDSGDSRVGGHPQGRGETRRQSQRHSGRCPPACTAGMPLAPCNAHSPAGSPFPPLALSPEFSEVAE